MAWKGYVICDRAFIDPAAAWKDALDLRSYELDSAISQSQVLYFVATMDDFVPPIPTDHTGTSGNQNDRAQFSHNSELCAEHSGCSSLGLTGGCCPTSAGAYLGCCDSGTTTTKPASAAPRKFAQLCTENQACSDLGLQGLCCPSSNGVYLGCCNTSK